VHVQRTQSGNDQKIRQDERPAARPRPPEAAAQIRDEDAHLDRERSRQRLTYGDRFAHLLFAQPTALGDQFAFHLANQGHGSTKAEQPQAQKNRAREP